MVWPFSKTNSEKMVRRVIDWRPMLCSPRPKTRGSLRQVGRPGTCDIRRFEILNCRSLMGKRNHGKDNEKRKET